MNNPNELFKTSTVSHLLSSKGRTVWYIRPHETVFAALQLMAAKNVGAVVVMEGNTLKGILSERDYARKVTLLGKSSMTTPVQEVMTSKVVTVGLDHTIGECMEKMTFHKIRHLPVVEGNQVIGLISIGDLVKAFIMQQEFFYEQYEHIALGKQ